MAKKGGVQQLQADLQSDEDFETFLERPGLLVLDVYSEWCGPCLGMVGALRKMKLEMGGDNMQLAICKSDTITALNRFNKKSEPTWLFVSGGKAVNIMFGTDVPKLMALVSKELEKTMLKSPRITYTIEELQPIEIEQQRIKTEALERLERLEREAQQKKQLDYLTYVTDTIIENIPDVGVTVFGPQVNRDMFKKLQEPAEQLRMQCKDRKVVQVTTEQFDIVNFACKNPLPPDVIEQLDGKELLLCYWKIDESIGTMPNVLATYAHELTKDRVAPPNDQFDEEHIIPPIISPMKLKIEVELEEGEEWIETMSSSEEEARREAAKLQTRSSLEEAAAIDEDGAEMDEEEEASEEEAPELEARQSMGNMGMDLDLDIDIDDTVEEEEEIEEEVIVKARTRTVTVKIPPVWVPNNRRTHAALVYVFFRNQTTGFLAPDPKPEPPHVIMAFDVSKRRDLLHTLEHHKAEITAYGFFTSDDPDDTTLIATTNEVYSNSGEMSPTDKLVLKVTKVQSNMMLSLVTYGPSYVSPNVNIGREEGLKFFPENYRQMSEAPDKEDDDKKKKRKGKKSVDGQGRDSVPEPPPEKEAAAAPPTEGEAPPPSGPEGEAPAGEAPAGEAPAGETAAQAEGEVAPAPPTEGEAAPAPAEGEAVTAPAEGAAPAEAAPAAEAPQEAPPPAPETAPDAPKEEAAPAPEPVPEAAPEATAPEPAAEPEAPAEVAAAE